MTKLEQILETKEKIAASRYSAAELERLAIGAEQETQRMAKTGEAPQVITPSSNREDIVNMVTALIDAGVDPTVIGQILVGRKASINSIPGMAGAAMMGVSHGKATDVNDTIITLLDRVTKAEMSAMEARLSAQLVALDKSNNGNTPAIVDPIEQMQRTLAAFREMGLLATHNGNNNIDSIEKLKEQNRHAEKVLELNSTKEYHDGMVTVLSSIPEKIGAGIANRVREQSSITDVGDGTHGMKTFACHKCGKPIVVPPEAVNEVICGSCGQKHAKNIGNAGAAQDAK